MLHTCKTDLSKLADKIDGDAMYLALDFAAKEPGTYGSDALSESKNK